MKIVTEREYEEIIKSTKHTVFLFSAKWCGPCQSKTFQNHQQILIDRFPLVDFFKVDIDQSQDLAEKYNIASIPTFIITYKGNELDRTVGANTLSVESKLQSIIGGKRLNG